MIIHLYTLCYNEIALLPFAVDYWKSIADRVVVMDNGSDDGSLEYLGRIPWVEVRPFGDGDGFNDCTNALVKNTVWKESRGVADFVIVSDFDEFIYSRNLKEELQGMKERGETLVKPRGYELLSDDFPIYREGVPSYHLCQRAFRNGQFDKCAVFDPNAITEMNYTLGAHRCRPTGDVRFYTGDRILLFHHKYLGIEYIMKRNSSSLARLSETSRKLGVSVHYSQTEEQIRNLLSRMNDLSVDVSSLL